MIDSPLVRLGRMACRTLEMFQAYGFAEQVIQEAYGVNEVAF